MYQNVQIYQTSKHMQHTGARAPDAGPIPKPLFCGLLYLQLHVLLVMFESIQQMRGATVPVESLAIMATFVAEV